MSSLSRFLSVSVAALALFAASGAAEARSRVTTCGNDQTVGAVVGAVLGGVIGSQFGNGSDDRTMAGIAGAVLGGAAGASVASSNCDDRGYNDGYYSDNSYDSRYDDQRYDSSYDDNSYSSAYDNSYDDGRYDNTYADYSYYDDAFENAAPYQQVAWQDPDSGYRGTIEPEGWYQDDRGQDCREFSQTIIIDGRRQEATGTACRQSDGTWRIVE